MRHDMNFIDDDPKSASRPFDLDRDGWIDLIVANDTVRNLVFHNRGDGTFDPVPIAKSGIFAWNNAKDVVLLPLADKTTAVAISSNNAPLEVYRPTGRKPLLSARR